jgi:hypothetical protein
MLAEEVIKLDLPVANFFRRQYAGLFHGYILLGCAAIFMHK